MEAARTGTTRLRVTERLLAAHHSEPAAADVQRQNGAHQVRDPNQVTDADIRLLLQFAAVRQGSQVVLKPHSFGGTPRGHHPVILPRKVRT